MFGYVRPDLTELKVKEFYRFRACYCGMCHELERSYGLAARFILNYDFVFLAMLLDERTAPPDYEMKRCAVSPLCARCVCCTSDALKRSAGYSVILAYWKVCDSVEDERSFARIKAQAARLALKGAYKRARALYPAFDEVVRTKLSELAQLEKAGEKSLDRAADKFALLLGAAGLTDGGAADRVREQLLYHLGRVIYIADAYHDLEEDLARGEYNPIAARYDVTSLPVSDEARESVRVTLRNSVSIMMADFELIGDTYWAGIMRNILFVGVPKMCDEVIAGTYQALPSKLPKVTSNGGPQ